MSQTNGREPVRVDQACPQPPRGKVTVGEWSERWLATRQHLKPYTLAGYRSLLRNHVLPRFASTPLNKLEPIDVREWLASLDLSASRKRQAFHVLSGMLQLAVESRYLVANPCRGVDLPRHPNREMRFLNPDEIERLASAVPGRYRSLVLMLAYGGLRWGEAAGLKVSRCDLLRSRIEVAETLIELEGGGFGFGEPKTYQRRTVTIPRFLRDSIGEHLATVEGELVFTSPRGAPLRRSNFNRRLWQPALAVAGIEPGLRVHDMRHTATALLIHAGAHPKQVQDHLGHQSITVTMNRYGHLMESAFETTAEKLETVRAAAVSRPDETKAQVRGLIQQV